jgi:hypothetical protein
MQSVPPLVQSSERRVAGGWVFASKPPVDVVVTRRLQYQSGWVLGKLARSVFGSAAGWLSSDARDRGRDETHATSSSNRCFTQVAALITRNGEFW